MTPSEELVARLRVDAEPQGRLGPSGFDPSREAVLVTLYYDDGEHEPHECSQEAICLTPEAAHDYMAHRFPEARRTSDDELSGYDIVIGGKSLDMTAILWRVRRWPRDAAIASMDPVRQVDVEEVVRRLNEFTTCGCGDDDWPLLRHDTVHLIDAMSPVRQVAMELREALREALLSCSMSNNMRAQMLSALASANAVLGEGE